MDGDSSSWCQQLKHELNGFSKDLIRLRSKRFAYFDALAKVRGCPLLGLPLSLLR
jgi:hypothetical protein